MPELGKQKKWHIRVVDQEDKEKAPLIIRRKKGNFPATAVEQLKGMGHDNVIVVEVRRDPPDSNKNRGKGRMRHRPPSLPLNRR
ncbi:hypothetical protein HY227_02840 [Candidatus Wolfebacteria bacterium]|nr:hypothetical protein [Candidatus Wolfebacteria bacterium]